MFPEGVWEEGLIRSDKGKVQLLVANAMHAFRSAPEWRGVFAWNDFSNRPVILRAYPGRTEDKLPRDLTDNDVTLATEWLQRHTVLVGSTITREAIYTVASDQRFHPVRDYLHKLVWDGTHRINHWLTDHLGADDTQLHQAFASKWLIGMVARVEKPGCQMDTALILESDQGLRKSTGLRELVSLVPGQDWFTDHIPDLANKDAQAQLQGMWLIELAELSAFSRAETHRAKAFLTTRIDRFRTPYGYIPGDYRRQCGFSGTVNIGSNGYLRDETGNRRFWTVRCGETWEPDRKVDIPGLIKVRDQLWAEALYRYEHGEIWWLDSVTLEHEQAEAAEERMEDDPRERKVRDFITGRESVHMDEILGPGCLWIPPERWSRSLRTEIGFIMSALKWERKRVRLEQGPLEWRYFPKRD